MSVTLDTVNSWPATLPLPFVNAQGAARVPTLVSPLTSGRVVRRRRWVTSYAVVTVLWKLTRLEYAEFLTFWGTTLGNGSARFALELRYPKNSELTEWVVQPTGNINVESDEDEYLLVQVPLQLVSLNVVADKAGALENNFLVGGGSSGAIEPFLVQIPGSDTGTETFNVQE